jgi:hypothetical protein
MYLWPIGIWFPVEKPGCFLFVFADIETYHGLRIVSETT